MRGYGKATQEAFPEAVWQRGYVHFLRNALDYLLRKADDDCLQELRWSYDRRQPASSLSFCVEAAEVDRAAV